MNTKIFTTFLLFAFFPILSFAQCNKLINIQVVDSKTRKPVPYVDVSIYDLSVVDAVFMQDKISDSNGIVIVPFKIYPDRIYKISAIKDGYRPAVENMINFLGDTFVMAIGAIIKKPSSRYIKIIGRESRLPLDSLQVDFYHVDPGPQFIVVGTSNTDSNGIAKVPGAFGSNGKINANSIVGSTKPSIWPMVENVFNFDSGTRVFIADIIVPHPRRLQDIYFAFMSDTVISFYRDTSDYLPNVIDRSMKNPTWKIEILGHSDNKEDSIDSSLSLRRADHVKVYLISKGINKDRIITKGLGNSEPKVPNEKNGEDDPEGRAENRRVQFYFIPDETGIVPKIEYEKR